MQVQQFSLLETTTDSIPPASNLIEWRTCPSRVEALGLLEWLYPVSVSSAQFHCAVHFAAAVC